MMARVCVCVLCAVCCLMCVLCVCCCVLPSSAVRAANSSPAPSPAVPKKQGHNRHVCVFA